MGCFPGEQNGSSPLRSSWSSQAFQRGGRFYLGGHRFFRAAFAHPRIVFVEQHLHYYTGSPIHLWRQVFKRLCSHIKLQIQRSDYPVKKKNIAETYNRHACICAMMLNSDLPTVSAVPCLLSWTPQLNLSSPSASGVTTCHLWEPFTPVMAAFPSLFQCTVLSCDDTVLFVYST